MDSPLRVAICEDDRQDAARLLDLLRRCGTPVLPETFYDAEALVSSFWPGKYDLIFLDIYMGVAKGIDAACAIRRQDEDVVQAFTTSSLDHALDGYRLGVLKYLEKPVTARAVADTVSLALLNRAKRKTIPLLAGGGMVEFALDDILFFQMDASAHAVKVHLYHEMVRISQSVRLDDIEATLPKPQFLRCHRGYIVNLRRVKGFDGPDFVMENGEKAYVRLKGERKVKAAYEDYMFALTRGGVMEK